MKSAVLLALPLLICLPSVAQAADPADAPAAFRCASRDRVLTGLETGFGETRRSIGLGADNSVMEVFASEETGTWTITMTLPDGTTCLMATGRAYEPVWSESDAALKIDF